MPILASDGSREDARARVLPAELLPYFSDGFVHSCDLHEEYVLRLCLEVVERAGLAGFLSQPITTSALLEARGLERERATVPVDWMLRYLAAHGRLEQVGPKVGEVRYRALDLSPLDPAEIYAAQEAHDPRALPSYRLARYAAQHYVDFLEARVSGDQVLFGPDQSGLWAEYFSNQNPLYAINNSLGAQAALRWAGQAKSVLELGGGFGSGAIALLEEMEQRERLPQLQRYIFSEFVPLFLRRGRAAIEARFGKLPILEARRVDLDVPLNEQGIEPGSIDLITAVNTVHVARRLDSTLRSLRAALAPGGYLVFSECVRPFEHRPIYVEFVFNLLSAFRAPELDAALRPTGGFLTTEQWLAALAHAGFGEPRLLPDLRLVRQAYPAFVVGAIAAPRE